MEREQKTTDMKIATYIPMLLYLNMNACLIKHNILTMCENSFQYLIPFLSLWVKNLEV